MRSNFAKVIRYSKIYGIARSVVKVAGRANTRFLFFPNLKSSRSISIVGCGQFAFSTVAYYLYFLRRGHFLGCYDIDTNKSKKLSRFYSFLKVYNNFNELISDPSCKLLYIASNHSSHTHYAIEALKKNIDVYIEKPISVNLDQLIELKKHIQSSNSRIFAGYNRPFSSAIRIVSGEILNTKAPISINCFISGHFIPEDHWYRNPEEGTRICGNMGHWIDLAIFLFNCRGHIPDNYIINISYADVDEPDDNINVSFSTDYNDVVSIMLTSRCEPFEGINETINIQCNDLIVKIDDFRKITIWKQELLKEITFRPKDVGHRNAIQQPFKSQIRDFYEIELSTILMLKIKDMVSGKLNHDIFDLKSSYDELLRKSE